MGIPLSGSVGNGGVNNIDDVKRVQQRLKELGFTFLGDVDGLVGPKTIRTIKLFQSIKNGAQTLGGDGLLEVGGETHKWLEASNAPQWLAMPLNGDGFINTDPADTDLHHPYGTNWFAETVKAAGAKYKTDYLDSNTGCLITVNDSALPEGGDTPDHQGHETGLSCDLRLPKHNSTGAAPGGLTVSSAEYSRDAARAMLKAVRAQPLADLGALYLNDTVLQAEGLCSPQDGHDNHIHIQIKPPTRLP